MSAQLIAFPERPRTPNRSENGRRMDALVMMIVEDLFGEADDEVRAKLADEVRAEILEFFAKARNESKPE